MKALETRHGTKTGGESFERVTTTPKVLETNELSESGGQGHDVVITEVKRDERGHAEHGLREEGSYPIVIERHRDKRHQTRARVRQGFDLVTEGAQLFECFHVPEVNRQVRNIILLEPQRLQIVHADKARWELGVAVG